MASECTLLPRFFISDAISRTVSRDMALSVSAWSTISRDDFDNGTHPNLYSTDAHYESKDGNFTVTREDGDFILSLANHASLDYEMKRIHEVTVVAYDVPGNNEANSGSGTIKIFVRNMNEKPSMAQSTVTMLLEVDILNKLVVKEDCERLAAIVPPSFEKFEWKNGKCHQDRQLKVKV